MSKGWTYVSGDWSIICDRCAVKYKASEAKQEWDGLIVCPKCWESRHPQDFIRVRTDKISVPFSRHYGTDTFINVVYNPNDPGDNPVTLEDGSFWITEAGEFVIANTSLVLV